VLLPKRPATVLRGIIKARRPAVTLEEMHEAVADGAAKDSPSRRRR
jgi:hypothetical protein